MARLTKVCIRCKKKKSLDSFYKNSANKNGLAGACKSCKKKFEQKARNTPERKKVKRKNDLLVKYGLSLDDYDKMFEEQNGVCAMCGKPETRKTVNGAVYRLSVDHNHLTNKNRGLLCKYHNTAIGQLDVDENLDMLKAALKYLEKYQ